MSGSADRSLHLGPPFRLVQGDAPYPTASDSIDWDRTRETLELFRELDGAPFVLPDMRLDEISARRVARPAIAAVIQIRLGDIAVHPATLREVEAHLAGRDPEIEADEDYLTVTFDMEDDSGESKLQAARFGYALALSVGGLPQIRVGSYLGDPSETGGPNLTT